MVFFIEFVETAEKSRKEMSLFPIEFGGIVDASLKIASLKISENNP